MNIADLSISITTDIARVKADMAAVKQTIGTAMKDVEQYVGYAKTAFIGLIGIGSIASFKGMIDSAIEGKAKLYDLSLQTGISVEALSALGKVAKYSHTSLDDIAGASNKLSKALFTQNEDSKGAAQTIKALGLNFNDFKSLGADQQLLAVAKAMDQFQDGTGKSAGAMTLFGKSGAQLLPFLKELADKNELVGKQTTASALAAKQYEDNLITLKGIGESWKNQLVTDILPALVNITNELIDGRKAYGSYWAALKDIGLNVNPFNSLNENLTETSVKFRELGEEAAKIKARQAGGGFMAGLWAAADAEALNDIKRDQATLDQRLVYLRQQQVRKENGERGTGDVAKKPKLADDVGDKGGGGRPLKDMADGYEALIKKLRTKIDLDQQEIALGRQLNDGEKLQIDVFNEVETNYQKLSIAKMLSIDETLQMALALGKERQAQEANLKWMKEAADANASHLEGRMQLRDQMQQERKDAELLLSQYGMTTDELRAMESARLRDAAAALERKSVLAADVDLSGQLTRLYRDQAEALRGTAAARELLAAKEARQAVQQERKDAELLLRQYGMTTDELRAMESARLSDAAAALERRAVLAADVDLTGQLTQLYRDQADALRGTTEARDLLAAKEAKDRNDPLSGANRAVKEYLADVKRMGDATYGAVANSIKGLEDLTVTALMGGDAKNAAKAWVNGMLSEVYRLRVVKPLLDSLFGKDALGGGGGIGDIIAKLLGGGGNTGALPTGDFARMDRLPLSGGRVDGGPVGAGQNYLVGESGPEVLRMGRQGGSIIPNSALGGGSRPVMVNIINNGAPVQAKSSQRETSEGTVIDLVLDAVAADMAGGGKVHDATQRRFGLNPGGSTPRY